MCFNTTHNMAREFLMSVFAISTTADKLNVSCKRLGLYTDRFKIIQGF